MEDMMLTTAGRNVLAKCLLSKELKFSRVALGDGEISENENVEVLNEMKNERMTLPIERIEIIGDGTVKVVAHSNNSEVYDGFQCREHGLFCFDPDNGQEVLYSYINVGNMYSFIPSNVSSITKDIKFAYITEISNAANVTAVLDLSFAYTSEKDFQSHVDAENPHPNLIQRLDEVQETDFIWATDSDKNLHLISLENLKNSLREEGVEKLSDFERYLTAKMELGLEANILMVEDFKSLDTLDLLKLKVTSCARGGKLIGVESVEGLKIGGVYLIADEFNQENITVKNVKRNVSGTYLEIERALDNSYSNAFLYRSALFCGADFKSLDYEPRAGFGGYAANIQRVLDLDFDFVDIAGGVIEGNSFTLA